MSGTPDLPPLMRPYALTGGRTKPTRSYPMEALVITERSATADVLGTPQERAIAQLCRESRSLAEVAAIVHLPLGVVRVLVGDLADRGIVRVHGADDSAPGTALLERVLSGLRKL